MGATYYCWVGHDSWKIFIYFFGNVMHIYSVLRSFHFYFPPMSSRTCLPPNFMPLWLPFIIIMIIIISSSSSSSGMFPVSVDHVWMGVGPSIGQPTSSPIPKESESPSISNQQLSVSSHLLVGCLGPCPYLCWEFLLTWSWTSLL